MNITFTVCHRDDYHGNNVISIIGTLDDQLLIIEVTFVSFIFQSNYCCIRSSMIKDILEEYSIQVKG